MENTVQLSFEPYVPLHRVSLEWVTVCPDSVEHPNLKPPAASNLFISVCHTDVQRRGSIALKIMLPHRAIPRQPRLAKYWYLCF